MKITIADIVQDKMTVLRYFPWSVNNFSLPCLKQCDLWFERTLGFS